MAGLIGTGQIYQEQAKGLINASAELEERRNEENRLAEQANISNTLSSATTGAIVGAKVGGPWGAAAGAAVGILSAQLF